MADFNLPVSTHNRGTSAGRSRFINRLQIRAARDFKNLFRQFVNAGFLADNPN